jgi:hypothetical protein
MIAADRGIGAAVGTERFDFVSFLGGELLGDIQGRREQLNRNRFDAWRRTGFFVVS